MQRRLSLGVGLLAMASLMAGCAAPPEPKPQSERVSRWDVWAVNQTDEMCFAYTITFTEDNLTKAEPDAYLYVTTFRDGEGRQQPSVIFEHGIPKASVLSIDVAGQRFILFTNNKRRQMWLNRRVDELDFMDAMLKAESLTVSVRPPEGEPVRLHFYTLGFDKALEGLKKTCA